DEVFGLLGYFVNTLVLRLQVADRPTFAAALDRVRETTLGAFAHQALPFDRLVEALRPERDLSYAPLFQVMFTVQNAPIRALRFADLELAPIEMGVETAKFDLTVSLAPSGRALEGGLGYNRDLFDAATAERLVGHFRTLVAAAVAEPDRPVSELPL